MNARKSSFVQQFKQRLKPMYLGGQRLIVRTLFAYSSAALEAAVRSVGIGPGDKLFVHSGFGSSGFSGTPGDVIESLLNVIGADGNLLMMSIPYRGSSQRYAEGDPLFDVLRTPSAVGLISEIFRRRAGVHRSLNPFHPVLASGPLAAWLIADHELCVHSCGKGSPFERFLSLDGTFLFFNAPFSSLTFMHYVEDYFSDRLPVELYGRDAATLRVKDPSGRELAVRQFFFSEAARGRRNFSPIEQSLLRAGAIRTARVGNTRLMSVKARSVIECTGRLLERDPGSIDDG